MTFKEICLVGIKVLAGIGTGLLVFFGLTERNKTKVDNQNDNNINNPVSYEDKNSISMDSAVSNLQKAQDICGKVFSVVQTITIAGENLYKVFNSESNYIPQYGYYNNPWSYNQPINMGNGQTWNRISPFIVEAPNTRPYGGNNVYVGPNGGYPI